MHALKTELGHRNGGFTLTEVLIASFILTLVLAAAGTAYTMGLRIWRSSSATIDAASSASTALTRCTFGSGNGFGLRSAFAPVDIASTPEGWYITFVTPAGIAGTDTVTNRLVYSKAAANITYQTGTETSTVIGRNIIAASVQQAGNRISLTIRARARVGDTRTESEMTTSITPRNRS